MSKQQFTFKTFEISKKRMSMFENANFSKCLAFESSNYGEKTPQGVEKLIWIIELFELWRFESWKVSYESFLRNFHGAEEFIRTMEVCELW